jgi:hypothetical protein
VGGRNAGLVLAAAGVLATLFLFSASGRLASGDAGAQMQATMLLAATGKLGAPGRVPPSRELWVEASNGRFYEAHDIGNVIVMAPAALLASVVSSAPWPDLVLDPPLVARVAASMTFAALATLGAFFLFLLFSRRYPPRVAIVATLGLPITTFYWVYARAAWDVLGAAVFVSAALYFSFEVLAGRAPRRNLVLAAAAVAAAGLFRFSLLPTLGLGLVLVILLGPARRDAKAIAAAAVAGVLVLVPELVYNAVRMGNPLRPATTADQFSYATGLGGNIAEGVFGLLAGPNKGLFLFAPALLLMLALPLAWRRLEQPWRRLLIAFGVAAVAYLLLIGKLNRWGPFGWGPRYLTPLLPLLYVMAVLGAEALWPRWRAVVIAIAAISVPIAVSPVLVNWNATATAPEITAQDAGWPRQQYEVFRGLARAVSGDEVGQATGGEGLPVFPDVWWMQVGDRTSVLVSVALALALLAAGVVLARAFRRATAAKPT